MTLPAELLPLIVEFAPLFSKRVWAHAKVLLIGAILAPGKRPVTSCLRAMGLSDEKRFEKYHRVLNRARWSALEASNILLRLLVLTFALSGEIIIGLDDQSARNLSGSGTFLEIPFRQNQWVAMVVLYVAGHRSVGRNCLGLAVSDRACSV